MLSPFIHNHQINRDIGDRKDFESYLEETHDLSPFYFDRREDGSYYDELIEVAYQCWIKAWLDGWNERDRIV